MYVDCDTMASLLGISPRGLIAAEAKLRNRSAGPQWRGGSIEIELMIRTGNWTATSDPNGPVPTAISSIYPTSINRLRDIVKAKGYSDISDTMSD